MSIGYKLTNVSTQGIVEDGWFQGRGCRVLHQRVVVADNNTSVKIGPALPSNSKIVAAHMVAHSAIGVDGTNAAYTANAVALVNVATYTAATSGLTTNSANNNLVIGITGSSISSNTRAVVHPAFQAILPAKYTTLVNTSTNDNNLFLVPMDTQTNGVVNTNMAFNGTANVDVTIYFEEFADRYVSLHSPAA